MTLISQVVPLLYLLFILGLCAFLLVRGITHSFIALFACGALLEIIPHLGFVAISQMPGGFGANAHYFAILRLFGWLGLICFAIGFLLLAKFLLAAGRPSRV